MYIYNLFASKMHCISNSKEQRIYQLKYNTCTMQNTHKEKYVSSSLHLHVCKILLKNPINILKLCLQTEKNTPQNTIIVQKYSTILQSNLHV